LQEEPRAKSCACLFFFFQWQSLPTCQGYYNTRYEGVQIQIKTLSNVKLAQQKIKKKCIFLQLALILISVVKPNRTDVA